MRCFSTRFMAAEPFGQILLASDENGLCGLWFANQAHFAMINNSALHCVELESSLDSSSSKQRAILMQARQYLHCYFAKEPLPCLPPLSLYGTPFALRLYQALSQIPYGQTRSYSQIAQALARTERDACNLTRQVAKAIGKNPLSIFIPCHRVIGKDGSLKGYAGGLARKQALLLLESSVKSP